MITPPEDELHQKYNKLNYHLAYPPATIDSSLLNLLKDWSESAFGPGKQTEAVLKHIEKELNEIRADPDDLEEWIDVMLLAINGAARTGADGDQIIWALKRKIKKNATRVWPDWRNVDPDLPIEHIK
jgi:hypothetical protein